MLKDNRFQIQMLTWLSSMNVTAMSGQPYLLLGKHPLANLATLIGGTVEVNL